MRHVDVEERLLRKRLAVRVIALRNEKDWSQSELSRRLGDRTRGRVIRLEKAASGLSPTLGLVALLAKVFGMTPMEFIAPVLAPKDPKLAQRQAVARFQRDIDRLQQRRAKEFVERYQSPRLEPLINAAALAAMEMTDAELEMSVTWFMAWASQVGRRREAKRGLTGTLVVEESCSTSLVIGEEGGER